MTYALKSIFIQVIHTHLRLETAIHGNDKGIVGEAHDISLSENLFYLIAQHEIVLVDLLHGESLPRGFFFHQINSTVGTIANKLEHLVIALARNTL